MESRAGVDGDIANRVEDAGRPSHDASADPDPPAAESRSPQEDTFMGGVRRRGQSAHRGPAAEPNVAWRYRSAGRIFASPVIGPNGHIYIGSLDGTLSALQPDGQLAWRFTGRDRFYATAAVHPDGTVYVASDDQGERGHLYAIDPSGALRWQVPMPKPVEASLLVTGDAVYVASDGLYALDARSGRERWHVPAAGRVRGAPALHPDGFLVVGTAAGNLLAIDPAGSVRWRHAVGGALDGATAIGENGVIYVGSALGHVVAVDARGQELWRVETGGPVRATPAIHPNGTVVVGSYDRMVYGISQEGTVRFRTRTSGRVRASARIDAEGRIYLGSQDGFLYSLTEDGEIRWRFNIGQDVDSTVAIGADGTVYFGADDGSLRALR